MSTHNICFLLRNKKYIDAFRLKKRFIKSYGPVCPNTWDKYGASCMCLLSKMGGGGGFKSLYVK